MSLKIYKILFPFRLSQRLSFIEAGKSSVSPGGTRVILAKKSSLVVLDLKKPNQPIIYSFQLQSENEIFNSNIRPVWKGEDKFCISFTKSIIYQFDLKTRQKKSLNIHTSILSILLINDRFAILVPNQKIHVLNDELQAIMSFDYTAPFSVFNSCMMDKSDYIFVNFNNKLFIAKSEPPFSFNETTIKDFAMITRSPDNKHYAISYQDGSICLYSIKNETVSFVERIYYRQTAAVYIFWPSNTQVCVVFSDGSIVISFLDLHLTISRTYIEIAKSSDIFYSEFTRKLYFVYNNSLRSLSFISIHDSVFFDSDSVYDLNTSSKLFDLKKSENIYPIRLATEKHYLGQVLYTESKKKNNCNFDISEYFHGYYFGLNYSTNEFTVMNDDKIFMKFPSLLNATKFSVGKERMIGFLDNKLLVIDFGQQISVPRRVEAVVNTHSNDKIQLTATYLTFRKIIKNAVCATDTVYIQFDNNLVVQLPSMKTVSDKGNLIWREKNASVLFVQTFSGIEIFFSDYSSHIESNAISSSNGKLIQISPEGKDPFIKVDYCISLAVSMLSDPEMAAAFISAYRYSSFFRDFIPTLFASITSSGNMYSFIKVLNFLEKTLVAEILTLLLPMNQITLIRCGLDVIEYIESLSDQAKLEILLKSKPETFLKLAKKHKLLQKINKNESKLAIQQALDLHQWSRAIRMSHLLEIDIAALLNQCQLEKTTSLAKCVRDIRIQSSDWKTDESSYLRYLGCAFIVAGFENWGISSFIAAKDESKVKSALERLNFSRDEVMKLLNSM